MTWKNSGTRGHQWQVSSGYLGCLVIFQSKLPPAQWQAVPDRLIFRVEEEVSALEIAVTIVEPNYHRHVALFQVVLSASFIKTNS